MVVGISYVSRPRKVPIPARIVSHISKGILTRWSDLNNVSIEVVIALCILPFLQLKRCIVFSASFLQHGHLSESVTNVFDFFENRCFWTPVFDMLFMNLTKREKSDFDFLKIDVSAIPR